MKSLKELYDERNGLIRKSRQVLDRAEKEGRGLNSEEVAECDKLEADIAGFDTQIQNRSDLDARKERQKTWEAKLAAPGFSQIERAQPGGIVPASGTDGASLAGPIQLDFLAGGKKRHSTLQPGTPEHARAQAAYGQGFRRYILSGAKDVEQLGLQVGKDSAGGSLAPISFAANLIKFMDDNVWMRQLATVLPPLEKAISLGVPSYDSDPGDADWTAEVPASDISEDTGATFGKREFMPNLLSKLIKISMKLLRSSVLDIESFMISRLGYKFAITEEKGFLSGSGAQQPLGLFTSSSDGVDSSRDFAASSTTGFSGDDLIDCKNSLKVQYQQKATWLISRTFLGKARKLKDGMGQYLWQPGLQGAYADSLVGSPYRVSEYVPATFTTGLYVGIIGDMSYYWIVDSLETEIQRFAELFGLRNQIGILARKETDGMPVLAEAFARMKLA